MESSEETLLTWRRIELSVNMVNSVARSFDYARISWTFMPEKKMIFMQGVVSNSHSSARALRGSVLSLGGLAVDQYPKICKHKCPIPASRPDLSFLHGPTCSRLFVACEDYMRSMLERALPSRATTVVSVVV